MNPSDFDRQFSEIQVALEERNIAYKFKDEYDTWEDIGQLPLDRSFTKLARLYLAADDGQKITLYTYCGRQMVVLENMWLFVRRLGKLIHSEDDAKWLEVALASAMLDGGRGDFRDLIVSLVVVRFIAENCDIDVRSAIDRFIQSSSGEMKGLLENVRDHPEERVHLTVQTSGPPEWAFRSANTFGEYDLQTLIDSEREAAKKQRDAWYKKHPFRWASASIMERRFLMSDLLRLLDLLESDNHNKRYDACEQLRVWPYPLPQEAKDALIFATNDANPDVADAAQRALALHAQIDHENVIKQDETTPASGVLHEDDSLHAERRVPTSEIPRLLERLKDPEPRIRREACEELKALAQLPHEALAALRIAVADTNSSVSEAAQRALAVHSLTSKPKPAGAEAATPGIDTAKPTEYQNMIAKIGMVLVAQSFMVFVVSLTQVGYHTSAGSDIGALILVFGWAEILLGIGVRWLANPALVSAYVFILTRNYGYATIAGSLSVLFAASFLINKTVYTDYPVPITGYGLGYWLWLASTIIAALSSAFLFYLSKREASSSVDASLGKSQ